MAQSRDSDLSINFDEWLRSRLARYAEGMAGNANPALDSQRELRIALRALELYSARHPQPTQVNQKHAAEMLGVSAHRA